MTIYYLSDKKNEIADVVLLNICCFHSQDKMAKVINEVSQV